MVVRIPIEDWIDLHTFSPKEIPSLLEDYLLECQKKGFSEVRIIHGKGKGVQMNIVHSFLEKSLLVESYRLAPPGAGSWGATIAYLKKPRGQESETNKGKVLVKTLLEKPEKEI